MPFIDLDVMFVVDIYTQDIKNQSLSTDIRVYSTRKQLSHLVFYSSCLVMLTMNVTFLYKTCPT